MVPPGNDHLERVRATNSTLPSRLHMMVALAFILSPTGCAAALFGNADYEPMRVRPFAQRPKETLSLVYEGCALLSLESPVTRCAGNWLAQGVDQSDCSFFAQWSKLKASLLLAGGTDNEKALGT
ncbi:hypothetical protein [Caballeronia sp. SBC2]|uniref:hypothetical protein n=1 Tax=Caballeronia sp. SBC2 TaxID=2705547 RepID=UPI0013EB4AB3|nr:hypothetical protein [Caballeronia sp. SBC2]